MKSQRNLLASKEGGKNPQSKSKGDIASPGRKTGRELPRGRGGIRLYVKKEKTLDIKQDYESNNNREKNGEEEAGSEGKRPYR